MRCIAIDDEPVALALVCSFVKRTPGLELVEGFTDPREAVAAIQRTGCDLLLLDLHMPCLHGFDVLRQLAEPPLAIVTTAHGQHAAASYDLEVVDYLMKPFAYERFLTAVERARAKQVMRASASVMLRSGPGVVRVNVAEITYVEAFDDYIKVHRSGQRPIVALSTLKAIEGQLPADRFLRIHRSFIVHWAKVIRVKDRRVHLPGIAMPVGDTYWPAVKAQMERDRRTIPGSPERTGR